VQLVSHTGAPNPPKRTVISTSTSYTVLGDFPHTVVVCDNASGTTIYITTANLVPGDQVTVIRANLGAVSMSGRDAVGNLSTIDGQTSRFVESSNTAVTLEATALGWFSTQDGNGVVVQALVDDSGIIQEAARFIQMQYIYARQLMVNHA
jgi:hypothetical protein